MTTLLIATRNAHKAGEIQVILGADFHCLTLDGFPDAPPVLEDADTFAGNATKKAVELARWLSGSPGFKIQNAKLDYILADDSGLEVDVLGGTRITIPSCCACCKRCRRVSGRPDSAACWRWCRARTGRARSFLRERARGGFSPVPAGRAGSATTRCLCRPGTSNHSPSWARQ